MKNKKVCLILIASFVLVTSCKKNEVETIKMPDIATLKKNRNQETTPRVIPVDGKYPVMTFDKTEHDFGIIEKESKVGYTFDFKNTGEADLIITNAVGSCGCTIPEYPKEAIKPGESGRMKVSFNASGKHGQQQKTVTITTNTSQGSELLHIKAAIKE